MARRRRRATIDACAVWWIDAVGSQVESYPPEPMVTLGFGVHDADSYIVLAAEAHADGERRSFTTIPKSLIKEIHFIRRIPVPKWVQEWRVKTGHA